MPPLARQALSIFSSMNVCKSLASVQLPSKKGETALVAAPAQRFTRVKAGQAAYFLGNYSQAFSDIDAI